MPTTIESSGKTLDEAIRSGLSVLGVEREAVTVEILSKPKTGFFGIGSTHAKVKLTLAAAEKPAAPEKPVFEEKPKKQAQAQPRQPQRPAQPQQKQPRPAPPQATEQKARPERTPPRRPTIPATDDDIAKADEFIKTLLKHFDMGMSATTGVKDGVIQINIDGENVGNLIGRHGETLDAIQHIVMNVVNLKNDAATVRVQVDAADYRSKRQSALEQLARRMAENAKKYNSNMTLEPMNAYERHVIHVTLQDVPGVATFSTGSEPQRRVVISSTNARSRRGGNDRRPPRENTRSRPPRDDSRPPRESQSARPAPKADGDIPAPPPPRTLPVKEFGVKKQ